MVEVTLFSQKLSPPSLSQGRAEITGNVLFFAL
jgi:hypothetical protein